MKSEREELADLKKKLDAEKRGKNTAVAPEPMALNKHMTWAFA